MAELREVRIRDERPPAPFAPPPRGRSAPAVLPQRQAPEDPERQQLIEKPKSFDPLDKVPMWLYDELVTVSYWPNEYKLVPVKITKAAFLWWSNFVCFVAHTSFMCISIWASTRDGKTMATPLLSLWTTNLTWVPDSTDALIPRFQKSGGLHLAWMTLFFFLLSALAHLTVITFNFNQAFVMRRKRIPATIDQCCNRSYTYSIHEPARKVTFWTGWYFTNLHLCRNPLRWLEYSFSASLMALVFAVAGGLNHIYFVVMIFALMWVTNVFGWVSEVYNRPISRGNDIKPYYWLINDHNPHLLTYPDISARLQRLIPYFLGWITYMAVWGPLLHSFFWNVQSAPEGGGPPPFVYAIIVSQFILFSFFAISQFIVLVRNDGPSFFFWSEWSYVLLSLLAKGVLGGLLIVNVLLFDSFEDAVAAAD